MKKRLHIFGLSWSLKEVVILSAIIAILILLIISCIFLPDVWENLYIIPIAALVVASIAAIGTLVSLKLTRDTIRPFIYTAGDIVVERPTGQIRLIFNIYNSGSLPGEDVNTDITFFDKDEEITEENLSNTYETEVIKSKPSILFPNSKHDHNFILDLGQANDLKLWNNITQGKTKCRIRTTYKSLGRNHITIQTGELAKVEWAEEIVSHPISPQKWT
jgi:hypothetical protein